VVQREKWGRYMENKYELLCDWLDEFTDGRPSVSMNSKSIFIELLRFTSSLREFPFRDYDFLREFLKKLERRQIDGELDGRWMVKSQRVQMHRLRSNKPRVFTFTRSKG